MDAGALHQLLRAGLGKGGLPSGVCDDELDLASGDTVAAFAQEQAKAVLHLAAAGGQRARFDAQHADAQRCGRKGAARCHGQGGSAGQRLSSREHRCPPFGADIYLSIDHYMSVILLRVNTVRFRKIETGVQNT